MKILIADDEFFARKAVVQMVLDWNPAAVILEAEDGTAALAEIESERPDLVLTDIRMPGQDGIALAAHVHRHYPQTLVAIISGFDDFAYAQEAIRHKVEHYLLKPMDKQELIELLEQWRIRIGSSQEAERERALAACLFHGAEADAERIMGSRASGSYQMAVIRVHPSGMERVKESVMTGFSGRGLPVLATADKRYDHLLIALVRLDGNAAEGKGLQKLLHDVLCDCNDPQSDGEGAAAVGLSAVHTDWNELRAAYQEAKNAVLQSMLAGGVSVHGLADGKIGGEGYVYDADRLYDWTETFNRKIAKRKLREAAGMVEEWLESAADKRYSAYMAQDWFAMAVKAVNAVIGREGAEPDIPYLEQRSLEAYPSLKAASRDVADRLLAIDERLQRSGARTDMVERIKEYVESHYKDDIMLEDLAKQLFFVDPDYLSRLFKKKSGVKFSQYLLTVRMEKARRMLESEADLSVSEVAREVGYNDYSYFIQMYKRVYGETPGKFRSGREKREEDA